MSESYSSPLSHLEDRVTRIEKEMGELRAAITKEQVLIENLRVVTSEHGKQLDKIAKTIEKQTESISELRASTSSLKSSFEAMLSRMDLLITELHDKQSEIENLTKIIKEDVRKEKNNTQYILSVLRDVVIYGFVVLGGLKIFGVI